MTTTAPSPNPPARVERIKPWTPGEQRASAAISVARFIEVRVFVPALLVVLAAALLRLPATERGEDATMCWIMVVALQAIVALARWSRTRPGEAATMAPAHWHPASRPQLVRCLKLGLVAVALTLTYRDLGPHWAGLANLFRMGLGLAVEARMLAVGILAAERRSSRAPSSAEA
jgi:hypothetical protein